MKILSGISVLALLMAGAVTPSFATLLSPGQTVVPGSTSGSFFPVTPVLIEPYSATPASGPADTGTVLTQVGTFTGNPFGANDLTFLYEVQVTSGDMARVTTSDFSGFNVDVAQVPVGGSTNAAVSADMNNLGVVGFNFTPPIGNELGPGMETYLLIVNTNATSFVPGTISVIDAATATVNGYAPAVAPEPSSLCLLGTGLLAAGAGFRRRMRFAAKK